MPKTQTLLQVFAASPGDVAKEREILESAIREVNRTSSNPHNIRLELIRWETHSRPGFGKDPQDVINQQIGDNYDIFLGIMWGRFGSPTQRAESSTEEEFNRALSRRKDSPESIEIMFYFKKAGIPLDEIELDQIAKIRAFKKRISSQGGLYYEFEDGEDFEKGVRKHLADVIQDWPDWRKRAPSDPEPVKPATTSPVPAPDRNGRDASVADKQEKQAPSDPEPVKPAPTSPAPTPAKNDRDTPAADKQDVNPPPQTSHQPDGRTKDSSWLRTVITIVAVVVAIAVWFNTDSQVD